MLYLKFGRKILRIDEMAAEKLFFNKPEFPGTSSRYIEDHYTPPSYIRRASCHT